MTNDEVTKHFESATIVAAEGSRVAFTTCKLCGASVLLDPRDKVDMGLRHLEWHMKCEPNTVPA